MVLLPGFFSVRCSVLRGKRVRLGYAAFVLLALAGSRVPAQTLIELNNGNIADANELNHNFNVLSTAVAASVNPSPFEPSFHITLGSQVIESSPCSDDRAYTRINLDGSIDGSEFVVPADHILFITDVSYRAIPRNTSFSAGRTLWFSMWARAPGSFSQGTQIYLGAPVQITTVNDEARLGATDSIVSGVALGAGKIICANATESDRTGGFTHIIDDSFLRGILVPDS